jgi:vacuolar-type H+-ATPase subunit I/STV1
MKDLLDQGVVATKEFAVKAGAKAQDLGERGVLMVEIKQLEGKAQKLLSRMGNEVYRIFEEKNEDSISRNQAEIKTIMEELTALRDSIEKKEADLRSRR